MHGQVRTIAEEAKQTGEINFGGEYRFLTTDTYDEAYTKLYRTACAIGGIVEGDPEGLGFRIKVFPCYDAGYWSFEWLNKNEGVRHIRYWTCEVVSDDQWKP